MPLLLLVLHPSPALVLEPTVVAVQAAVHVSGRYLSLRPSVQLKLAVQPLVQMLAPVAVQSLVHMLAPAAALQLRLVVQALLTSCQDVLQRQEWAREGQLAPRRSRYPAVSTCSAFWVHTGVFSAGWLAELYYLLVTSGLHARAHVAAGSVSSGRPSLCILDYAAKYTAIAVCVSRRFAAVLSQVRLASRAEYGLTSVALLTL